jgi:hypothetical protein
MKKQPILQLNQAYTKSFKILSKNFFGNKEVGLTFFVDYLKYLRDCIIINTEDLDENELIKTKIATLVTAIAEYDTYKACQDTEKRAFHWNNFCELVKLNMEEWLEPDDSV